MFDWKLLSSDSHIIEPPGLWQERMDRPFRERGPHVIEEAAGERWVIDGMRGASFSGGAQSGMRFERAKELRPAARFSEVRPASYEPTAFLAENQEDGVWGSVIYTTAGLQFFRVADIELMSATFRAYNDWLADFCSASPGRLKGVALINVQDVEGAIREMTRVRKLGMAGVMITVAPPNETSYDHPMYEPFWAAVQDLAMPISLHVATNSRPPHIASRPSLLTSADYWVRVALGDMILSGVFERYPKIRVCSSEHELAWAPHFIERLDYTYTQRSPQDEWHLYADDALPSDFFRQNVVVSFQEDAMGVRNRDLIGVDCITWGSDYPHTESTFPRSRSILERILEGVDPADSRKITAGNLARLYDFDAEALG